MVHARLESDDVERIESLENELAAVRDELLNLQSARSVRLAGFAKQALRASPSEWPTLFKSLPEAVKKKVPSSTTKKYRKSSTEIFNPLYKPTPLYKFPNLNVATIGTYAHDLFSFCCNTIEFGSGKFNELKEYGAINAVVISGHYTEKQKSEAHALLQSGTKIIALSSDETFSIKITEDFGKKALTISRGSYTSDGIIPFVDIYNVKPHSVSIDGVSDVLTDAESISLANNINSMHCSDFKTQKINRGSLIALSIDQPTSQTPDIFLGLIARGVPTIFLGKKLPEWAPEEAICIQRSDLNSTITNFNTTPYKLEQYAITCKRSVILSNNAFSSVSNILYRSGALPELISISDISISVILASKRPHCIDRSLKQLEAQTIPPKEVKINMHGVSQKDYVNIQKIAKESTLNVTVTLFDKSVIFGDVLNAALDKVTSEFVTKIDDDDYYGPNHLKDLYIASLHSRADFIGKWSNWTYLKSEDRIINWLPEKQEAYVHHLPGGTIFCRTAMLKGVRFGHVKKAIDSELYRRALARGAILYSTHRYNYVRVRDGKEHTYKTTDADFKSRAHSKEIEGLDFDRVYC